MTHRPMHFLNIAVATATVNAVLLAMHNYQVLTFRSVVSVSLAATRLQSQ